MKKVLFLLSFFICFSINGMTPGEAFKNYIKVNQKDKSLSEKVKIGEGLFLDLSNPSEKFVFGQMDITILKEVILNNKAEVYFLITWPIKSISMGSFLKKEERKKLENKIPNEYTELKKIGEKRVVNVGTLSTLKGKIILYKLQDKWSQPTPLNQKEKIVKTFCITHHIEEAMELNKKRKIFYSALTGGQTQPISDFLIASEKMSLIAVKMMELQALPFNQLGIDILCKEVISMSKTPLFQSKSPFLSSSKMKRFKKWKSKRLAKNIYKAYNQNNFKDASKILREEIHKLEKYPGMYCMHRHVIESMLRASNYGPIHKEKAKSLGLSTKEMKKLGTISWNFILSQIITFPLAHQIDKMAFPFQRRGIPIICQDVPYIPEY